MCCLIFSSVVISFLLTHLFHMYCFWGSSPLGRYNPHQGIKSQTITALMHGVIRIYRVFLGKLVPKIASSPMRQPHRLLTFLFYAGYAFLYIPIILIIVYALNGSDTLVWQGASLKWFRALLDNGLLWQGAMTSTKIALMSATLSVLLGTVCATLWTRAHRPHRLLGAMASMPLVIPEVVTGLALLFLFVGMHTVLGWPTPGMMTVTAAHTSLGAAYVTAIVRARLGQLDPKLTEAGLDLRATPLQVFWLIKFPLIVPSLVASWLIAFIISFDDVVLASFTSGPGTTTLPLMIFSSIKVGYTPQINALAACIVLMVSVLIMGAGFLFYRKDR